MFELDSDRDVLKFLGLAPITTLQEAEGYIKYIKNQYLKNGTGRWAIVDKKTNDFVGWTGLKYEEEVREEFSYYDLGYRLLKKYWGQGIATETALASLQYGFEVLDLKEIGGAAHVEHAVSNKVLTKVGFRFVETFEFEGMSHNFYNLSKEHWLANQAAH